MGKKFTIMISSLTFELKHDEKAHLTTGKKGATSTLEEGLRLKATFDCIPSKLLRVSPTFQSRVNGPRKSYTREGNEMLSIKYLNFRMGL